MVRILKVLYSSMNSAGVKFNSRSNFVKILEIREESSLYHISNFVFATYPCPIDHFQTTSTSKIIKIQNSSNKKFPKHSVKCHRYIVCKLIYLTNSTSQSSGNTILDEKDSKYIITSSYFMNKIAA